MVFCNQYAAKEPTLSEIEALEMPTVLEFGTAWCGYCQAAQRHIAAALADDSQISHIKVEDGPGRPLGRSFRVKLWPTLVFLKCGKEVARLVRPQGTVEIRAAVRQISDQGDDAGTNRKGVR